VQQRPAQRWYGWCAFSCWMLLST